MVLRTIFGPKGDEVIGAGENCVKELHNLYFSPTIGMIKTWRMGGQGMWHAWGAREMCTKFWLEGPKGRDYSEDIVKDGRILLKCVLGK
jgi:hypothetical protein